MIKYQSLRLILSIAAQQDMHVHQMDVKTSFLNGELQEEIYMEMPEGLERKGQEGKALRLRKSLYGLKQSPRWIALYGVKRWIALCGVKSL